MKKEIDRCMLGAACGWVQCEITRRYFRDVFLLDVLRKVELN